MMNGYFVQALNQEFYRIFARYDIRAYITTKDEKDAYRNFGYMYLMGGEL